MKAGPKIPGGRRIAQFLSCITAGFDPASQPSDLNVDSQSKLLVKTQVHVAIEKSTDLKKNRVLVGHTPVENFPLPCLPVLAPAPSQTNVSGVADEPEAVGHR